MLIISILQSLPASDSIVVNKRDTQKQIRQELDTWEEDRKVR